MNTTTASDTPLSIPDAPDASPPSSQELDEIWANNYLLPKSISGCVHDLITNVSQRQPDARAVCAWDGDFTYAGISALSDHVAYRLCEMNITPKSSLAILFPKSRWTCVAMLGIMKAGHAAVALDLAHPNARLQSIIRHAQPKVILCCPSTRDRASILCDIPAFQLDDGLLGIISTIKDRILDLPEVSPKDLVYISFTSGTTGQPKGACISHSNVRSAVYHQGGALGFHPGSRVFDFAPYSFDVAWSNVLHTLCAGGCLCIANEEDMVNDLSAAITNFAATLINVTPTVLRTISPVPPTLRTVLLSGEMPYRENVTEWAGRVRLLNTYGPTECTWKCTFSRISGCEEGRPDIGRGVGFCLWIVNPSDSSQLVSPGLPGELYLEGPMVGQGYLSNSENTNEAFISDPPWLLSGSAHVPGRRGSLYRTGDLVRTRPDGSLLFLGRKDDSQLKVRGQRIEIGDVEYHARACLDDALTIVADILVPAGSETGLLALFVQIKAQDPEKVVVTMRNLVRDLPTVLPAFMLPSIYLPVDQIPVAATGKVDRRKLREMGGRVCWEQLLQSQLTILPVQEYREPHTGIEKQLCELWAQVLNVPSAQISATDSFIRLGGDSISAMLLVAAARQVCLLITVADVLKTPVLSDLALMIRREDVFPETETIAPFSLLAGSLNIEKVRQEAARACGIDMTDVQDVYPCTALQQGMLSITARSYAHPKQSPVHNVARTLFQLPRHADLSMIENAWRIVVHKADILRTRIVDLVEHGLVQVVVQCPVTLNRFEHITNFVHDYIPMGMGKPLCRAGIILGVSPCLIMEIHHSIFDGWSTKLILDAVEAEYHQEMSSSPLLPFRKFVKYVKGIDQAASSLFWKRLLANGSESKTFPSAGYQPGEKVDISHAVLDIPWANAGTTPSSIVQAALALLLASYTNSNDIRYGATISGRQATVAGIERIAGPTIATIPIRAKFDWNQTAESWLEQVQRETVDSTEHAQFGLQHISRLVEESNLFQLLLVVQPLRQRQNSEETDRLFSRASSLVESSDQPGTFEIACKEGSADSAGIYNPYPMLIICQLQESGLELRINFDSGAIAVDQVQRMSIQLENLLRQLCAEDYARKKLCDITAVTKEDLADIWTWNKARPITEFEAVTDTIQRRNVLKPERVLISAWDRHLTAHQVESWSTSLAARLRHEGVAAGSIIILASEKCSWQVVLMLAALQIGAVVLPMSVPVSKSRALQVVENLKPQIAVTSTSLGPSSFHKLIPVISIDEMITMSNTGPGAAKYSPRRHLPSDPALLLFTSGSTGTPKAIQWSHRVLATNVQAASKAFRLTGNSRVFQFAGYDFDVSTVEILASLCVGACLCIPSEADRTNALVDAINGYDANWMCLTPTVSETLIPTHLPSLKTIVFAGEKLEHKTAFRWIRAQKAVYNWYGPAEASLATSCHVEHDNWYPGLIGQGNAGLTWLVDPKNPNLLAPVGAVAELCIEGPILAQYAGVNEAALNKDNFISPSWLENGHCKAPGRSGPVYRTGDLVVYNPQGSIAYLGRRNDSQRKIRGQRIDLSEIERCIQEFLTGQMATLVAEIISFSRGNESLALFVIPTDDTYRKDPQAYVRHVWPVDALENHLTGILPSYMIPRIYIPLSELPIGPTGKINRRRLQEIGASFTSAQLADMQPTRKQTRKTTTDNEKMLQIIWANVLGVEMDIIKATDHFLRLGGDSISAMRLVGMVRDRGLSLTVADVFNTPELENMAEKIGRIEGNVGLKAIPAFSLLPEGIDKGYCRSYVARACSVAESQVLDIYPCTALQEGLLALGVKRQGRYVSRSVLPLQRDIDPDQLKSAWAKTVTKLAIMRTRIVDLPGKSLLQVVLEDTPWRSGEELQQYLENDEMEIMGLGTQLCHAAIIDHNFIFTIHHCLYDGNSLPMILEELQAQYYNQSGRTVTGVEHFIDHLSQIDRQDAGNFWKAQLSRAHFRSFPTLPYTLYEPQASEVLEHSIALDWPAKGATPSTIFRAAWAILQSQYIACEDIIFGVTVSGRQANMTGIENCVVPTIATVPIAMSIDWESNIEAFLQNVQKQGLDIMPYEQYGLPKIHKANGNENPGLFQTLLVVQPIPTEIPTGTHAGTSLHEDSPLFKARTLSSNLDTLGVDPFNVYALMVICQLTRSGLNVQMSLDPNVVEKTQIRNMTYQLETIIRQLCTDSPDTVSLNTIQTASDLDIERFWVQNGQLPPEPTIFVHDMTAFCATNEPDAIAVNAWDGQLTYAELDQISTLIAHNLMFHGITKGSIVPLCFAKSRYMPLAQIAVWKAGAVTLLQSADIPEQRMSRAFQHLGVQLALASPERVGTVSKYAKCITVEQILELKGATNSLPALEMKSPATILISSGSTGEPKHILWSHRALAANTEQLALKLSVNASSRVFQFSSYDFDVATLETLMCLTHGATLCIPSEAQRLDGISAAINQFGANWVFLTPSTARLICPQDIPSISTIVMGGENVLESDVEKWKGYCAVRNWYGPAEFPAVTVCASDRDSWSSSVLSHMNDCCCWLVDPQNHHRLVPYGAIGEILVQGPACASGYVGNSLLTESNFCHTPAFLSAHAERQGSVYRTGDLARFDSDGHLIFLGRKDSQVKVLGQLVVPKEVEIQIQRYISSPADVVEVIVDTITPSGGSGVMLVAFVITFEDIERLTTGLNQKLLAVLPRYAVPSWYIAIPSVPLTTNGKRDRKRLLEIAASSSPSNQESTGRAPVTTAEITLAKLWSLTLGIDVEVISTTVSFLQIGNSIDAMRLVGTARQHGLVLTVAGVMQHPIFEEMASLLERLEDVPDDIIEPFTLLDQSLDQKLTLCQVASACDVKEGDVEDIFPCTALQTGLLALTVRSGGDYTSQNVQELGPSVDVDRFKHAWEELIRLVPILRTRIVDLSSQGFVQVVIREQSSWSKADGVQGYLSWDRQFPMGLGSPLMRCGLFATNNGTGDFSGSDRWYFALTMHHSIYDGPTSAMIMGTLKSLYYGETLLPLCPFQNFVKYISNQSEKAGTHFWKAQFEECEALQFPLLPSSSYQPRTDSTRTMTIKDFKWRKDGLTSTTIIRSATALVCAQHSMSSDVVFGTVVMGRKAPIQGTERIAGPTIATVPIRVRIPTDATISQFLQSVQDQERDMIPHEHMGLSNIRKVSTLAETACRFQTLLVIQPPEHTMDDTGLFVSQGDTHNATRYHSFSSYALLVVCNLDFDRLKVEFCYDSLVVSSDTIQVMSAHLEDALRSLCAQTLPHTRLNTVKMMPASHLNCIWAWNATAPNIVDRCMHDMITEVAQSQPDAIAISAWDGNMTYGDLDLLSTRIAVRLVQMGVKRNMIVPLCFEKSLYVMVALLGVIKAGGATLLLDLSLPDSRLDLILQQLQPTLLISSTSQKQRCTRWVACPVVLGKGSSFIESDGLNEKVESQILPSVSSRDLLYIVFTSGSTGTPKGCLIQHQQFTSAVVYQRAALEMNQATRLYDFSSHSFDAVYWCVFHVWNAGGTLCIPSEEERKSDLTESVRRFDTSHIFLTPSTARLIDPDRIPTLRYLFLGGEAVLPEDIARWPANVNTVEVYGPSECSVMTSCYRIPLKEAVAASSIGKGIGTVMWVVDPENQDRLAPLGTVGELFIEGPLVGQGYYQDQKKTTAAFIEEIESPSWLVNGSPDGTVPGRRGRMYKTGDLVKYHPITGNLVFVGRKDTQVKLRGQRIELADVEHHIMQCLVNHFFPEAPPTGVAEVITPTAIGRPMLVAFISCEEAQLAALIPYLEAELPIRIPTHMVPAAFIAMASMPMAPSGKLDRRRLRDIGSGLTLEAFSRNNGPSGSTSLSSLSEIKLQGLWVEVLGVSAENIGSQSSFIRLGGDSISAMRLASLAHAQGLALSVYDILKTPLFSEMIRAVSDMPFTGTQEVDPVMAFSLLKQPSQKNVILADFASQCQVHESQIQDIFPCTGVQKSLLSMTAKQANSYVARVLVRLRKNVDESRLMDAWENVSRASAPILRSRIVDSPIEGLVQGVVDETLHWDTTQPLQQYLRKHQTRPIGLGTPLTRLAIIEHESDNERYCLLTQHHAMYDGYSLDLLMNEVSKAYCGFIDVNTSSVQFQAFIKHVMGVDVEEAKSFWSHQFADFEAISFPALPHADYRPKADSTVHRKLETFHWSQCDFTPSTIIRASWAILTARYIDSDDIVFGAMVTGRQASLPGLDRMLAPLINAVPVRVKLDFEESVDDLLAKVQKQSIDMIPYEQTELLSIRQIDANTNRGTQFNTLLVIQPPSQSRFVEYPDGPFEYPRELVSVTQDLDNSNPNAIMIMCRLTEENGLQLEISFDSKVIDAIQMARVASQFEHILRQVCVATTQTVGSIQTLSGPDLAELWNWNAVVPQAIPKCVHTLIATTARSHGEKPAICAWDGNLSYNELDRLSTRLASDLIARGLGIGSVVPLCFDKSMWHPVAVLGVMKSGAVCLSMDSTQPKARLHSIVQQVKPRFILASSTKSILASHLSDARVIVIDQDYLDLCIAIQSLPTVKPSDVLYVVFTSGSTGTPKGVVTTHQNFASAAIHQANMLRIKPGTRVFDFVSYSFDVSWSNTLQTLICGGCLCIPAESERRNDIAGAFNRMKCNYSYFTPSVVRSLEPLSFPGLQTLAMGGEPIPTTEAARWKQTEAVIGIYGPAECAQALTFTILQPGGLNNQVGYSYGARTWLVQPDHPDRLASIGAVGELLIEGPTVSQGYLNDSSKTAAVYIHNPSWLLKGAPGRPGRQAILYKTGDLLRYNSDGSLQFLGRKDGMVKLRGQRIELTEVEYHIRANLCHPGLYSGLAAEIITPRNGSPILAVFIALASGGAANSEDTLSKMARLIDGLEDRLFNCLPQYMVPGAYIPVEKIPMTTTDKTDRRALRQLGATQTLENLAKLQSFGKEHRPPTSPMERKLQVLWSAVLGVDINSINTDSNFLRVGGESIAAMRLVSAARKEKLFLTVADIFSAPQLSQLALLVQETAMEEALPLCQPFACLEPHDLQAFFASFVDPVLEPGAGNIHDVLPCTDFQRTAVKDALQDPPSRLPHWIFDLPIDVDFAHLEQSCRKLVDHYDILRTVFIQAHGQLWQVLLEHFSPPYDTFHAREKDDMVAFVNSICEMDRKRIQTLGSSFIRFMAIRSPLGHHRLIFRISHAQFDGFSWDVVLRTLSSIYCGDTLVTLPTFSQYITYMSDKKADALAYWKSRLEHAPTPSWRRVKSSSYIFSPNDRMTIKRTIAFPSGQLIRRVSPATLFHAACAMVLSRQFRQHHVVFGRLITGRSMLPSSLQNVVGPTMTEVPISVQVDSNATLSSIALDLQRQFVEDSRYETAGMEDIIRNCTYWPATVNDFGWRTAFQQEDDVEFTFLGAASRISFYDADVLPRNRPEIYATPRDGKLELEFEGNRQLISEDEIRRFIQGLETVLSDT
ncbi:AMP-dependent synthetase/ligase [Penicillium longicatenatum]|nr:AMP-dependent synthetase/ligase [Penicillium longicatenatum]